MPNIAKVLKDELCRLARREAKRALTPVSKLTPGLRRTAADLKRRVAHLEKELRSLRRTVEGITKAHPPLARDATDKARITAKGMRSLRRRLRLSGQNLAKLLGITPQAVYWWEKSGGPLRVRRTTRAAILAVRGIGAREARRRLEEMKRGRRPGKTAQGRRTRGSRPTR